MCRNFKFLICSWGNPACWKDVVEYHYKNQTIQSKDPFDLLKDVENPDKTIIVACDTLSDNNISKDNANINYETLKKESEKVIIDFCKENFKSTPDKVIVSYGFGEFNNIKFSGNAMDFYYKLFQELVFALIDWVLTDSKNRYDKIEVIFDATHGINSTTILAYRALKEILGIFSFLFEVKFTVLNSDPYIGRNKKVTYLAINIIEENLILPKIEVYNSDKRPLEPIINQQNEGPIIRDLLREINYDKNSLLAFLGSVYFSMPVYILYLLPNADELKKIIISLIEKFEEKISISFDDKIIKVARNYMFSENFNNILKAYLISSLLNFFNFTQNNDISLSKIKELKNHLFSKLQVESNRVDNEIDEIKHSIKELNEMYKIYSLLKGLNYNDIDKRNFFAHAGFEYNSIKLKKEDNEVFITINEEKFEQAKNYLINDLPKLGG